MQRSLLSNITKFTRQYSTHNNKIISLIKFPYKTINFNTIVYDYNSSNELLNVSNNILDLNHTKITIAGDDKEMIDYIAKYIEKISFDVDPQEEKKKE